MYLVAYDILFYGDTFLLTLFLNKFTTTINPT